MAAKGTVTFTERNLGTIRLVKAEWTADSGGSVASHTTTNVYDGQLLYAATVPGTSANQPSASYDITVLDDNSLDVTNAKIKSQNAVATEYTVGTSMGAVAHSKLKPEVSGAGGANTGTLYLWIR